MLDIWEKSGCSWFHFDVSVMHHSRWYMSACVFGFFQLSVAFSATPLRQWEKLWWTSVLRFWRATGRTVQVPHLLVRYCESICMHTPNFHIHQGHTLFTERLRTACLKLHCTTNESNECPRYNLYPFHMKPTKICPPHKLCFFLFPSWFCQSVWSCSRFIWTACWRVMCCYLEPTFHWMTELTWDSWSAAWMLQRLTSFSTPACCQWWVRRQKPTKIQSDQLDALAEKV